MSSPIFSFPPLADHNARLLILGSMPGEASLKANEYYAHPRNQFWSIINSLFASAPFPDYTAKTQCLLQQRIALWDVMQSCIRPGSLDSAIEQTSIIANDFNRFLLQHPAIKHIFFNGATAATTFNKRVLPELQHPTLQLHRLPSTSPAHASMSLQQKLLAWGVLQQFTQTDN